LHICQQTEKVMHLMEGKMSESHKERKFRHYIDLGTHALKRVPMWLFPLVIALLLFPVAQIHVPLDGSYYIASGLNMYKGQYSAGLVGLTSVYNRPGFPAIIALAFRLFGVSMESAFLAARPFFVLNVVLAYFIADRLYNCWAGLVSSLLILTSATVNVWSAYIHLDHIMPFFVILSVLGIYMALEKQDIWWFALAGVALGLGYLVKEMTLLFFPLPILAFITVKEYRHKQNMVGLAVFLGIVALITLPWTMYLYIVRGEASQALGSGGITLVIEYFQAYNANVDRLGIRRLLLAFVDYYQDYLQLNFDLAPLFVVAWGYTLVIALVQRHRSDLILLLTFVLFSPIIVFQGTVGWRARQSMVFYLLSFVALARLLVKVARYIQQRQYQLLRTHQLSLALKASSVALVCMPILWQVGWEQTPVGDMREFARDANLVRFLIPGKQGLEIASTKRIEGAKLAGEWLLDHAPPDSAVLADWTVLPSIYFHARRDFPCYRLDGLVIDGTPEILEEEASPAESGVFGKHALFLWTHSLSTSALEQSPLKVFFEENLQNDIGEKFIDYVIVGPQYNFLTLYLMDSPSFQKVAEFGDGAVAIFEVAGTGPTNFETHADAQIPLFLSSLKEQNPDRYQRITSEFLTSWLGWKPEQVQRLLDKDLPTIEVNRVVHLDDYVALCESRGPDGISAAIARHREAASSHPHNPWPHITLGALYEASGSLEQAIDAYQQALALEPGNVTAHVQLIQAYTALTQKANAAETDQFLNEACAQALTILPDNTRVVGVIVGAYQAVGNERFDAQLIAKMATFYEGAIDRNPDDRKAYWNLATIYDAQGRLDEAIAIHQEVTERWPDASAYARLGRAYKQQRDIVAAITAYEEAVGWSPNSAGVHLPLARLYQKQGETDRAITEYKMVIALNSQKYKLQAYLELAALYESAGDMKNALALSQEAVAAFPDSPDVRLSLARVYEAQGRSEEAIVEYEQVIELDPPDHLRQEVQRRLEQLTNSGG
jgi:tetratricopeptide (TPR) repeat protein/4-amino-4-deoxy-L-arabinose transferase-like glycosyltransferase